MLEVVLVASATDPGPSPRARVEACGSRALVSLWGAAGPRAREAAPAAPWGASSAQAAAPAASWEASAQAAARLLLGLLGGGVAASFQRSPHASPAALEALRLAVEGRRAAPLPEPGPGGLSEQARALAAQVLAHARAHGSCPAFASPKASSQRRAERYVVSVLGHAPPPPLLAQILASLAASEAAPESIPEAGLFCL